MPQAIKQVTFITACMMLSAPELLAQSSGFDPLSFNIDGGIAFQSSADLPDAGGDFSVGRWFATMGLTYSFDKRNSIGLSVGGGGSNYNFDELTGLGDGDPWDDIEDTRISLNGRFALGETGSLFLVPSARYNGEDGADTSEGRTYGIFAAAAWRLDEDLMIGPGIGVFSRLAHGTRVFPLLVIDWNISERWRLSTSRGLAASQGPGLTLAYEASEQWEFGLVSRYENVEFRLDENGTTPGGIGKDQSLPVVASAAWEANHNLRLALFAGLQFGGKLKLKNAEGDLISESSYDTAPIYGATFELKF